MKRVAVLLIALFLPSISAAMPLDIDSLPPGNYFPGFPLVINTPLGEVHFVGEIRPPIPSDFLYSGEPGQQVLDILNRPPPDSGLTFSFAELMFDFDVFAITFIYSTGSTGIFYVETKDILGNILYSDYLDPLKHGPITIYGEGIRSFYWSDPGYFYAAIDNVDLNLPEPASLLLLGTGLGILWLGICRRK